MTPPLYALWLCTIGGLAGFVVYIVGSIRMCRARSMLQSEAWLGFSIALLFAMLGAGVGFLVAFTIHGAGVIARDLFA